MPQTIPLANTYQTHNNAQGQRGHVSAPTTRCVVESEGGRLDALCIWWHPDASPCLPKKTNPGILRAKETNHACGTPR